MKALGCQLEAGLCLGPSVRGPSVPGAATGATQLYCPDFLFDSTRLQNEIAAMSGVASQKEMAFR